MSVHSDGSNKKTSKKYRKKNISNKEVDDTWEEKDFSLEELFRGFEKTPKVELERLDLLKLITCAKKKDNLIKTVAYTKLQESSYAAHIPRLLSDCRVKVVKDDLDKLIELQVNNLNKADSDSDTMEDAAATIPCSICNKMYSTQKRLQKHQQNKHMIVKTKKHKKVSFSDEVIVHEVKEYHRCRKCTKIFEDYNSLKVHMKNNHKKRKCYICNYCSKRFVDRMFFKVHIKLHCDVCRLLLPNRSQYQEHRRNVCRVLKKYNCKTCMESFFKFMDLKDHSYDHLGTFFICDVCKDQFDKKCALAHHIEYLHMDQRPTALYSMRNLGSERLYLCNFCEESAVEKENIESHVQTLPDLSNRAMTGYKDYYFCDQCLKKFDIEKDMIQHKWSHFLKTSDNSQIRQNGILKREKCVHLKKYYNINETLPACLQPQIVLDRIRVGKKVLTEKVEYVDVRSFDIMNCNIKKPVVDPKSKKTIISKYQCPNCCKYFSSNYCLNRHIQTMHLDYTNLKCRVCEESFVWPSLLQSHKCIRLNHLPEMPFEDARPEIHFDNFTPNGFGFDDLNTIEADDYMHTIDFDIPEPIVEIREVEDSDCNRMYVMPMQDSYKVLVQEVPIEF